VPIFSFVPRINLKLNDVIRFLKRIVILLDNVFPKFFMARMNLIILSLCFIFSLFAMECCPLKRKGRRIDVYTWAR
jgi:hypothetical protein